MSRATSTDTWFRLLSSCARRCRAAGASCCPKRFLLDAHDPAPYAPLEMRRSACAASTQELFYSCCSEPAALALSVKEEPLLGVATHKAEP